MIKKGIVIILIPLVVISGFGCNTYTVKKIENAEGTDKFEKAKVTTIDDTLYILTDVSIKESQVRGYTYISHSEELSGIQPEKIVIPFDEIKKLEVQESETGSTITYVVILAFAMFVVYAISTLDFGVELGKF